MLPVLEQSRAEGPEGVLQAVEDQAAWGLCLHRLLNLFSHLQNGRIRFLSQELLCLYIVRAFCQSSSYFS